MTLRFTKKEILISVLAILLTAALVFAGFYFYISPKNKDIETKSATLKSEQQVLAALQQQEKKESDLTVESIAVLQRKVPVKPQLEQLILDLEKAETLSGSQIKNMSFAEADVAGAAPPPPAQQQKPADAENKDKNADSNKESEEQKNDNQQENQQNNANQQQANEQQAGQNQAEQPAPQYQPIPLPAGIKKLTVTLSVVSSDYYELEKFIQALESLPRTIVIESVGFSGGAEPKDLTTERKKEITYNITMSAFYMPSLTDLQDRLPEIVPPAPAKKPYPFYE
jgi:type IV pilus assembly protein PilO